MKNKIKGFAKGNFQLQRPEIVFSETHIRMAVGEGELYQGSFTIQNEKDGDIRGIVYPSSFRVHFTNQGFEGNPVEVKFVYDSTGMRPGQVENGKFTVVCNGGEYELSFTAMIEKPFVMTTYGKVQTIRDFRKLAMQDFTEAQRLFRMRQFYEILKYEDDRIKNLYVNMRKWALDEQALEEFLVGIKQKEKIFLTVLDNEQEFETILEDEMQYVEIQKNTWGHVPIRISADGDFIRVKHEHITTEDFVGNTYRVDYLIKKEQLHTGYNYGALFIETPYETLKVDIKVHQHHRGKENFGRSERVEGQGLKAYLSYIAGKTDVHTWCENALKCVEQLQELEPDNVHYDLLKAHVCIQGGRKEEAKWVMENLNHSKHSLHKNPEMQGYYLFVTALLRGEISYTNKVIEEITKLYMKHLYSWPFLCMLINLETKYKDYSERIRVLERQFSNGANHVLMYAEAYLCYRDHVLLLRKLTAFEIQILDFATKYKIISKELALHMADLMLQQKRYDKRFCRILKRAYKMYEEPKILQALCAQLINGNHRETACFPWYAKAVREGLKIAQLYEYYMLSMDVNKVKGPLPQSVYLYFMHGNQLDYKKTAILYANILTYEEEGGQIYQNYKEKIKQFAWEQLLKRHVNEQLRIIYNRFLKEQDMSPEQMEALYDICYTYQVQTDRKDMKYVLVIEKDGSIRQRVAHTEEGAIVYLYDKEARIIWESKDGVHYTDSVPYDTRRLFYEIPFISLCRRYKAAKMEGITEEERLEVSFENLKRYGMIAFDEQEVFLFCTRHIREVGYEEDDFLTYLCFALLSKGLYDKVLITYLCKFYCGATSDMKYVWKKAREYGVHAEGLTERIITQMLFSESMFGEEEVFEDYYGGKPYFRLKQAYFAYVSKEFVGKNREVDGRIFALMIREIDDKEYLADICKVALLKYYVEKEVDAHVAGILREFLRECCEKELLLACFMKYPKEWLREVQLYDKVLVEYHAETDGHVQIAYQINQSDVEQLDYRNETVLPTFENVYVKSFVLYQGESLKYYFKETRENQVFTTGKETKKKEAYLAREGKFGRMNEILALEGQRQKEAMVRYKQEEEMAERLFPLG